VNLAFCIFKYFPFGGAQRDLLRIATLCVARGHTVQVFTLSWEGEQPADIAVHTIPATATANHARYKQFVDQVTQVLAQQSFDMVVGFNKMPGLDIYYAADPCYVAKMAERYGRWVNWLPRYKLLSAYEHAVFNKRSATHIFLLTDKQRADFQRHYDTPTNRLELLLPTIDHNRMAPANAAEIRRDFRQEWGLAETDKLLLAVGSGFKTKGLDRSLTAMAALPAEIKANTRLMILGQDNPRPFQRLAKKLQIADRVHFLGGRADVLRFFLGADLLLHPAYAETAGIVLLEAAIAGLPIVVTEACGFAPLIAEANAGVVLPLPFSQPRMNSLLQTLLTKPFESAGIAYSKTASWYHGITQAVDVIEQHAKQVIL
jgi:UDP-glucose:(heptosyl)LPS alpha-1,3-glucosyltransferase